MSKWSIFSKSKESNSKNIFLSNIYRSADKNTQKKILVDLVSNVMTRLQNEGADLPAMKSPEGSSLISGLAHAIHKEMGTKSQSDLSQIKQTIISEDASSWDKTATGRMVPKESMVFSKEQLKSAVSNSIKSKGKEVEAKMTGELRTEMTKETKSQIENNNQQAPDSSIEEKPTTSSLKM